MLAEWLFTLGELFVVVAVTFFQGGVDWYAGLLKTVLAADKLPLGLRAMQMTFTFLKFFTLGLVGI